MSLNAVVNGMRPAEWVQKAAIATTAGRPASLWGVAGTMGPGGYSNTLDGVSLTGPVAGQIPFENATAPATARLATFLANASQSGTMLLVDRLWHNGGITITSTAVQNIVSPAWPARDRNGSADGEGVFLGFEVSVVTGAGTPTATIGYTNSSGVAGRSATNLDPTAASSAVASFFRIGRQAGDSGVRSVQSIQLSATWTSGTINLVAYRPIMSTRITSANVEGAIDALTGGLQRMYDGSCPYLIFLPAASATVQTSATVVFTHYQP